MKQQSVSLFSLVLLALFLATTSCELGPRDLAIPQTEMFPEQLSSYGIYTGQPGTLEHGTDFHLYELSSPLFSNYSKKQRLIQLPTGTQLGKLDDGLPSFPDGTALVKTFYYPEDERNLSLGLQVVETRVSVKKEGEWNMASYVWNSDQSDATLAPDGYDTYVTWANLDGVERTIDYHFPSQRECVSCHQVDKSVVPIGPSMRNLNRSVVHDGSTVAQLTHLQDAGVLEVFDISTVETLPNYEDELLTLEERARAYIDMNCSHCHRPGGWHEAQERNFDFRYATSLTESRIYKRREDMVRQMELGEMPYLGNTVIHEEGLELVKTYLEGL